MSCCCNCYRPPSIFQADTKNNRLETAAQMLAAFIGSRNEDSPSNSEMIRWSLELADKLIEASNL